MSDQEEPEAINSPVNTVTGTVIVPNKSVIAKVDDSILPQNWDQERLASNQAKVVRSVVTNPGEPPKFPGLTAYNRKGQKIKNIDPLANESTLDQKK